MVPGLPAFPDLQAENGWGSCGHFYYKRGITMSISSLLVPAILFFALGMFACIIKSDLKFPPDMHKMIVIYLLIGIGLHGGKALATSNMGDALPAVWAALAFG